MDLRIFFHENILKLQNEQHDEMKSKTLLVHKNSKNSLTSLLLPLLFDASCYF